MVDLDYSTTQHSEECASEQKWLRLETQEQRIEDCCEVCTIEVECKGLKIACLSFPSERTSLYIL